MSEQVLRKGYNLTTNSKVLDKGWAIWLQSRGKCSDDPHGFDAPLLHSGGYKVHQSAYASESVFEIEGFQTDAKVRAVWAWASGLLQELFSDSVGLRGPHNLRFATELAK